ncbi:MAG: glucosaminidase domain-containing protein [Crocinitomicaceae bacterium]
MREKINRCKKKIGVFFCFVYLLNSCNQEKNELSLSFPIPKIEYQIDNYAKLDSLFNSLGFELDSINIYKKVPQIYVDQITPSISDLDKKEKKDNFIRIILAHTLLENEEINQTRIQLYKKLNKKTLSYGDSIWLDSLSDVYRVKRQNYSELINKIDIIPPSLIIVQGIIESGWATSKYAIEGNNLFGMYGSERIVINTGDTRPRAKDYRTIRECVREYIINLNRHGSYRKMRDVRSEMRELGIPISGKKLASTLMNYSVLGERYVKKIISMINYYKLEQYDQFTLSKDFVVHIKIKN